MASKIGEKRMVLQMRYIHSEFVQMEVEDPDKCNLLDIFVELLEGAEKKGMVLPDNPTLWYAYNSQNFQLESVVDVVTMVTIFRLHGVIKLAIGSAESPSRTIELARGLIESKRPIEKSSHGSLPISSRRVPATTARRNGTYSVKARSRSIPSEPTSGEASRTKVNVLDSMSMSLVSDLPEADGESVPHPELSDTGQLVLAASGEIDVDVVDGDETDEDDYFDRIYDNGEFYGEDGFGNIKLKVWMIFMDKQSFMDVLRDYCIQEGFELVVVKADTKRYTAQCGKSECPWRIHASRLANKISWAIKTLNDSHTCLKVTKFNSMATVAWAAQKLLVNVRADEEIEAKSLQEILMRKYGINMRRSSVYNAKALAITLLHGSDDASYECLPAYFEVLKSSNPGSRAHVVWRHSKNDPEKPLQFKSVFISLMPMIEGFIHGCRGLIGVDGCHLKGKHGGVVLSAIAMDGNDEISPLAYGIYENKCERTWSSFF